MLECHGCQHGSGAGTGVLEDIGIVVMTDLALGLTGDGGFLVAAFVAGEAAE